MDACKDRLNDKWFNLTINSIISDSDIYIDNVLLLENEDSNECLYRKHTIELGSISYVVTFHDIEEKKL